MYGNGKPLHALLIEQAAAEKRLKQDQDNASPDVLPMKAKSLQMDSRRQLTVH